jgi:hypothetical protein
MAMQEEFQKDVWDKLNVVSKMLSAILLPVVLAGGGFLLNQSLENQRQQETRNQLYMTLMNQREGADSSLRKDMFQHIIKSVVGQKDDATRLRDQVLNLELLAHNFHDSIDLRPLFYSIQGDLIENSKQKNHASKTEIDELGARLKRAAAEIRNRQFCAIKELRNTADLTVDLTKVGKDYSKPPLLCRTPDKYAKDNEYFILNTMDRQDKKFRIRIVALDKNEETEEINVRVQIIATRDGGKVDLQAAEMWVGFYDFPAIDNLRLLGSDHRCAVILNQFEKSPANDKGQPGLAKISVMVFPACRASLKEKAYYEDVVEKLGGDRRLGKNL